STRGGRTRSRRAGRRGRARRRGGTARGGPAGCGRSGPGRPGPGPRRRGTWHADRRQRRIACRGAAGKKAGGRGPRVGGDGGGWVPSLSLHMRAFMGIQRLKLTGAAILVLRAPTFLQAAPAAKPSVRQQEGKSVGVVENVALVEHRLGRWDCTDIAFLRR